MYESLWKPEFYHVEKILQHSAGKKYEPDGWLHPDPVKARFNHKDNHASMSRHLAEVYVDPKSVDPETGESHALHLAIRALMLYTRMKRGMEL